MTWVAASGAPVLTECKEWTMCGVDCTELTGTDHTFTDAALLTSIVVVDVYQGIQYSGLGKLHMLTTLPSPLYNCCAYPLSCVLS